MACSLSAFSTSYAADPAYKDPRARPPIHLDNVKEVDPSIVSAQAAYIPEIGYYDLTPDFTTNLASNGVGRLHYLRVHVNIMVKDSNDLDLVSTYEPMIRDAIVTIIGTKEYGAISTVSGRESLRAECRTKISDLLAEKKGEAVVQDVLFTNYVYQWKFFFFSFYQNAKVFMCC